MSFGLEHINPLLHAAMLTDQTLSTDEARERRIAELLEVFNGETDREVRAAAWEQLKAEIKARSPAQVARMEAARGLV
jgi:hypothetical protein